MRSGRFVLLVAGLGGVCIAQPQQPAQSGSIHGAVASTAGEPLKNVMLRLFRANVASGMFLPLATTSDAKGNFQFDGVEPGTYAIAFQRTGYLDGNSDHTINVDAGESVTGIALKLTPQGVITGKVTDEDGDPIPNASIMVARWIYSKGKSQLVSQAYGVNADTEGNYAVGGLKAGSYFLIVVARPAYAGPTRQQGPLLTMPATYYPGVTDSASATRIQVTAGAVLRGVDVRVRQIEAFRIRGTVAGGTTGNVSLLPQGGFDPLGVNLSAPVRQGAFEIDNVPPGTYFLEALPSVVQGPDGRATTISNQMGREMVSVGNQDLENVVLQLGPGADIKGKIAYEGTPPPQQSEQKPAQITIMLRAPEGGREGPYAPPAQAKPDGTFEMQHIMPGRYLVNVVNPEGTYVKSIAYGGQMATRSAIELSSGGGGELQVTLSYSVAEIEGSVHASDGQPAGNVSVTVWNPKTNPKNAGSDMVDIGRSTVSDASGRFHFANLPPGEYRVLAWAQAEDQLETPPNFQEALEGKAAKVTVAEGEHGQIEAPLLSSGELAAAEANVN